MRWLDMCSQWIYPNRCPCCGELNIADEPCDACGEDLENCRIKGKVCRHCGLEKQYCQCREYHYLFEGTVAPYYNTGAAQNGVYMLKFQNAPFAAKFFGRQMAKSFETVFPKVKIDFICIVPSSEKDLRQSRYDKVELLAKACSKEMKIPLKVKALKKIRDTEKQHSLSHDKRQANVKGAYKASKRLDGKTVLLIDDIKTTGYTLNECSKQLRLAGAESVYCLTALMTLNKSCKIGKTAI